MTFKAGRSRIIGPDSCSHVSFLTIVILCAWDVLWIFDLSVISVEVTIDFLRLQLLLDVSVESALCDDRQCEILIKLFNVQVYLEQDSIDSADHIAQVTQSLACDVDAFSDGQMGQFRVHFESLCQSFESIVCEHVLIEDNRAEIGILTQVGGQHPDGVVMESSIGEVSSPHIVVFHQLKGWLYQLCWLVPQI